MGTPLLLVDVDGVISLFGFEPAQPPPGRFVLVDGVPHLISAVAGDHLRALSRVFELAWCTGWEEKANEHLPHLLGLETSIPHIEFAGEERTRHCHWKINAIERYASPRRPLAWIDDAHNDACRAWAAARPGRTLLLATDPSVGITAGHVGRLLAWAASSDGSWPSSRRG